MRRLLRTLRQIEHLDLRDCPVSATVLRALNMNHMTHLNMRGVAQAVLNLAQAIVERPTVALEYEPHSLQGPQLTLTRMLQITRCVVQPRHVREPYSISVREHQVARTNAALHRSVVWSWVIATLDSSARTGDRSVTRDECAGPVRVIDSPRHQHAQCSTLDTFDSPSVPRTSCEYT